LTDTRSLSGGIGWLLAVAAFLFLPLAVFASNGFAPLLGVTAVLVLAVACFRGLVPTGIGPVGTMLAAGFAYALASVWWSVHPLATVRLLPGLGATLLGGMILVRVIEGLDQEGRRLVRRALIIGGAVGYALIAFELATNGLLHRAWLDVVGVTGIEGYKVTAVLKRTITVATLYAGPFGLALYREFGRGIAVACVAVALTVAAFGLSTAAAVAGLVGLIVFALALLRTRATALALAGVLAFGVVASPWIPGWLPDPTRAYEKVAFLTNSSIHRMMIWRVTVKHIAERPVLGHGLNAARTLYPPGSQVYIPFFTSQGKPMWTINFEPIPLHPHNGFLQVWLELGFVGAMVLLGFLLMCVRAVMARGPDVVERAAGLGTLAATVLIYVVSFGAWQSWWLCGLFLLATWTLATLARPR
jgi:O-antigen ligase